MRKCGGGVEKCVGTPHYSTFSLLFSTRPHTSTHFHTNPIHSSTPLPPPNTLSYFFHVPPYLTQLPKLLKISQFFHHPYSPRFSTLLRFFPILPHTYFIIYPILNFLTFLIYCLISLAIKYTRHIKNFEKQNKKWQHNI